jgi:hypothetical protein
MIEDSANTELSASLMATYLKSMQSLGLVIRRISQVLSFLIDKRVTIAEKAIQEELALCVERESLLLYALSKAIKQKCQSLSENDCLKLRRINIKLSKQLQAFIKAATYNLNYLEQYFEHDFWLNLANNKFAEQLSQFTQEIESKKH